MNIAVSIGALVLLWVSASHAQSPATQAMPFPNRAIRIIVPFAADSLADRLTRRFTEPLGNVWRQEILIENRPGTLQSVPREFTARPDNDGHTLLLAGADLLMTAGGAMVRALQPVTLLVRAPLLVAADRDSKASTLAALVALAAAHPRRLVLRTTAPGTVEHLVAQHLARVVPMTIDPTPRRDLPGFLEGAVDVQLASLPSLLGAISAGALHPLAIFSDRRAPVLRDVPTLREAGLDAPGLHAWFGFVTATGVSGDALARLHGDITRALAQQALHDALIDDGFVPVGSTPAELGAAIERDRAAIEALGSGTRPPIPR